MGRWGKWLLLLAVVPLLAACRSTPQAGQTGVVRNGSAFYDPFDWFDNHNIRGVVHNGQGNTFVGLGSDVHYYPAASQQRFFKAEACFNAPAGSAAKENCTADRGPYTFLSADGVQMTIQGTLFLNTSFDGSPDCKRGQLSEAKAALFNARAQARGAASRPVRGVRCGGDAIMKSFDQQFSTRTFDGRHPYDGDDGWSAFLGAVVDPIVQNDMRDTGAGFPCKAFISSCVYVQNQQTCKTGDTACQNKVASAVANANNQKSLQRIQTQVQQGLSQDVVDTLGGVPYFNPSSVRFVITHVALPPALDESVQRAQSAFAQITEAQAHVASANADAAANEAKQAGYNACHACQQIDENKAWTGTGVTTVVFGGNGSVAIGGGK